MNQPLATPLVRRCAPAARTVMTYTLLLALALVMLAPLVWMVSTSLKTKDQVFTKEIHTSVSGLVKEMWPTPVRLANYSEGMRYVPFPLSPVTRQRFDRAGMQWQLA